MDIKQLDKSMLRMQKLAGLITESELKKKLNLNENVDPKTADYLDKIADSFLYRYYGPIKAGKDLKMKFKYMGDYMGASVGPDFEKIGNEYVTFKEDDAFEYMVKKLDEDNYEIKVFIKKTQYI